MKLVPTIIASLPLICSACTFGTVYDTSTGDDIEGAEVDFMSGGVVRSTTSIPPITDPSTGTAFNYALTPYSVSTSTVDWGQVVPGPWALAIASAEGYDREAFPAEHDWLTAETCQVLHNSEFVDRACIRRDLGITPEGGNHLMLPDLVVRRSVMTGCSTVNNGGESLMLVPFAVSNLGQGPLELLVTPGSPNAFQIMRKRTFGSAARFVGTWLNAGTVAPWWTVSGELVAIRLRDEGGAVVASSEQALCARDDSVAAPELLPGGEFELAGLQLIADQSYGGSVEPFADVDCTVLQTQGIFPSHSSGQGGLLDVTGLPDGDYTLEVTVNPTGLLSERSLANNTARIGLSLGGGEVTSGCDPDAPAPDSPGLF